MLPCKKYILKFPVSLHSAALDETQPHTVTGDVLTDTLAQICKIIYPSYASNQYRMSHRIGSCIQFTAQGFMDNKIKCQPNCWWPLILVNQSHIHSHFHPDDCHQICATIQYNIHLMNSLMQTVGIKREEINVSSSQ
jgi:hypothetical protein